MWQCAPWWTGTLSKVFLVSCPELPGRRSRICTIVNWLSNYGKMDGYTSMFFKNNKKKTALPTCIISHFIGLPEIGTIPLEGTLLIRWIHACMNIRQPPTWGEEGVSLSVSVRVFPSPRNPPPSPEHVGQALEDMGQGMWGSCLLSFSLPSLASKPQDKVAHTVNLLQNRWSWTRSWSITDLRPVLYNTLKCK